MDTTINYWAPYSPDLNQIGLLIEHICYKPAVVVKSQIETARTLTTEECRPASRIAAP
jgi:hypothetical protein